MASAFAFILGVVGCSSDDAPGIDTDGPGAKIVAGIIACKADSDCRTGETCGQGFCQMKRCADPTYESVPPFGAYGYASVDRAFIAASDSPSLQAFSAHGSPTLATTNPPLDVAGGNLTGTRPESVAFITSGSGSVSIVGPDGNVKQIDLGWQGKRLATGDVDGDGIDEIVVMAEGQEYAICRAARGTCEQKTLASAADDVAVGDVDGDGLGEVLFIGNHTLTIVNVNPDTTGEKESTVQPVTSEIAHITAGDLDGDGRAEIIGTEIGGVITSDKLHVFQLGGDLTDRAQVSLGLTLNNDALDVAFARQDDKPVVGVLSDSSTLRLFSLSGTTLTETGHATVAGKRARRLAAADVNGRSAIVRLKGPAKLEVGPVVPLAVLTLPPYSAAHSSGPSTATLGTSDDTSDNTSAGSSKTDSVSLQLGLGVSASAKLGPVSLSGSVTGYLGWSWSRTASHSKSVSTSLSVGKSYSLTADPQADGFNSGGVVLAGGCFHRYDYAIDDPQKLLGETAEEITSFVPVGGETTLWSTNRYNALVDAVGTDKLPKVTIPTKLGNVGSYPSKPTTLDGKPIAKADNVFTKAPITRTSDVGTVGFSLSSSESTTNRDATSFSYGQSWSVAVSGGPSVDFGKIFNVGVKAHYQHSNDTTWSLDQSYSVTVGTTTTFSGRVAPVRDDPSTPANESSLYGYSFQPVVYRHHFKNATGNDGAFYVLTYTAGK